MDHANQSAGQPPPDSSSTQPFRITPGWPAGYELAPGYEPPSPSPQPPGGPGPRPRTGRPSRLLRWTSGIAAAGLLAAGGTLAGLKLAGNSARLNTPVAVALFQALDSSAGADRVGHCRQAAAGSSAGSQTRAGLCHRRRHLLRLVRGMYGQVTYHGRAWAARLAFERGAVESARRGHLVVRAADGTAWTWVLAGNTVVRRYGRTAPRGALSSGALFSGALSNGARVFVVGRVSGSGSNDARLVLVRALSGSAPGSSSRAPASSPAAPGRPPLTPG
jgi:hypothetical protein